MKLYQLLAACAVMVSIPCTVEDFRERDMIKTPQEAAESLQYMIDTDIDEVVKLLKEKTYIMAMSVSEGIPLPSNMKLTKESEIDKFVKTQAKSLIELIAKLNYKKAESQTKEVREKYFEEATQEGFWGLIKYMEPRVRRVDQHRKWKDSLEKEYKNFKCVFKTFELYHKDEHKKFEKRMDVYKKAATLGRLPPIVACRIKNGKATIMTIFEADRLELKPEGLLEMSGLDRGNMYIQAGEVLQDTIKSGGFIDYITLYNALISPSNVNSINFDIIAKFYAKSHFSNPERTYFIKKHNFSINIDFFDIHAKSVLQKFIKSTEDTRDSDIDQLRQKEKRQKNPEYVKFLERRKIPLVNLEPIDRTVPLPLAFSEFANEKLTVEKSLEQIITDLRKNLDKAKSQSRSPSPTRRQRSRKSSTSSSKSQ